MALPDPQSATIGLTTYSLPRITDDGFTGTYQSADGTTRLSVTSAKTRNGRLRATVRLDHDVVAEDPLTSINQSLSGSSYFVFDFPMLGFDTDDKVDIFGALVELLGANNEDVLRKVLELQH